MQQLCASRLPYEVFWQYHLSRLEDDKIARASSVLEIVLIRDDGS
jgi:hypothetical protein